MKAMLLWGLNEDLQYMDWDWGMDLKDEEVEVELKAAALNHRDIWIKKGKYPGIVFPTILGSDGAGLLNGRKVMIDPALYWGNDPDVQSSAFQVLGMPTHGTFAEKIRIRKEYVHPVPEHLSFEEAAALPLAGLTAYRALFTRGQINKSDKVLIHGVGGGVAAIAFQFAIQIGCETWVTSGSDWKIEEAERMGAVGGVNYKSPDWSKSLKGSSGGFDLILDSAGGDGFKYLMDLARPGARICVYGGSKGAIDGLSPQKLFWKQVSILGSTMGSPEDFTHMLQFVKNTRFIPKIDAVYPLEKANEAIEILAKSDQFGKIVLSIDPE